MPYEQLQDLIVIDYQQEMAIMAVLLDDKMPGREELLGVGRYHIHPKQQTARVSFAVRDDYQNQGIAQELLSYLVYLARRQGLLGFTAAVLVENEPMIHVLEKYGFERNRQMIQGVVVLSMVFKEEARDVPPNTRSKGRSSD
jgi:RimJ/RimL family protein N-acetyltransferase